MKNKLTKPGRNFAFLQSALIMMITLVLTCLTFFVKGSEVAQSVFLGGLVGIVPNLIFAYKAFRYAGARDSKKVVESFFGGVKLKMVVMAISLGLVLKFTVIIPLPFFGMFILVMAMPLITPFIIKH